ncbi:MAG: thioesterase family protein [Bacteroidales bacterium]|jgi:fluoroacetyl-CoA thioesterase|nr:thioesterase family protein [Bacteroidales bacterium]MDI9575455.1 thioesterase family protein [Bacteroidota bacterium]MDD2593702.1 thioesterase family protein [Bacteroidales bacterium]MDD3756156.1 thioesterase family protein [Bacteroidales bacterium]MDY0401411.1 thioesterase family protein [Bacteroidales bacterium]
MELEIGLTHEAFKLVGQDDSAIQYDSGLVDVFSTPALVSFMEKTCMDCVDPLLDPDYCTVGIEIHVKHIKATKIGDTVRSIAKLIKIEGNVLTFEVKAYDSYGLIGEGIYKRYIIHKPTFLQKLDQ